jgi:hypothetical protein
MPTASVEDSQPDYIVESPPEVTDVPSRDALGLPPLTEFPTAAPSDEPKPKATRTGAGRQAAVPGEPASSRRGRRLRSAGEPGDMSEAIDWAGLSSRLSAYSLAADEESSESEDEDAANGRDEPRKADADE